MAPHCLRVIPVMPTLTSHLHNNTLSTFSNSTVNPVIPSPHTEFSTLTTVVVFFVGTLIVHIMTAHVVTPESVYSAIKRYFGMAISPVTAGMCSFNSLYLFGRELTRESPLGRTPAQSALSAGAFAIQIPQEFVG